MTHGLTDPRLPNRFQVISVDIAAGVLRVRDRAETCTDFSCREALLVTEEGTTHDLERLHAGDIVALEHRDGRAQQIRVVHRVWEGYSGLEW
ncbi:MAG TPA: hypothetical protein VFE48_25310 [Methylomirabilota bacterium]|nr:hypothetical protein [Methylomirabilota bacterium]